VESLLICIARLEACSVRAVLADIEDGSEATSCHALKYWLMVLPRLELDRLPGNIDSTLESSWSRVLHSTLQRGLSLDLTIEEGCPHAVIGATVTPVPIWPGPEPLRSTPGSCTTGTR